MAVNIGPKAAVGGEVFGVALPEGVDEAAVMARFAAAREESEAFKTEMS